MYESCGRDELIDGAYDEAHPFVSNGHLRPGRRDRIIHAQDPIPELDHDFQYPSLYAASSYAFRKQPSAAAQLAQGQDACSKIGIVLCHDPSPIAVIGPLTQRFADSVGVEQVPHRSRSRGGD